MMFGGEAPSYVCWGHNNRSAMIRVPMYKPLKGQSTRIELRTVDAACNPYLAFAVVLAAGMKGIEEDLELPREAEDDVWSLTERERTSLGIEPLPKSLNEAIEIAERSELLAETLGEHVFDFFLRNKRAEWDEYRGQVSAFERDRMLPVSVTGRTMAVYSPDRVNRLRLVLAIVVAVAVLAARPRGVHPGRRRRPRAPASSRWSSPALLLGSSGLPRSGCCPSAGRPAKVATIVDRRAVPAARGIGLAGTWLAFLLPLLGLGLLFLALIPDEPEARDRADPGRPARGRATRRTCSATGSRRPAARSTSAARTPATRCPTLDGYDGLLVLGGAMGANDDDAARLARPGQGADPGRRRRAGADPRASASATS